jgi:hypothetical protein
MSHPSDRPHVMRMAKAYADVLLADPVMAGQIKEHLPIRQLLEILQLTEEEVIQAYNIPVTDSVDDGE